MTSKPIWLLDFDGVLNAISRKPPTHVWPRDQWITTEAKGRDNIMWPILAAKPVLDFVRDAHEKGLADIRWHSTWQQDTVNLSEALDLPMLPVEPAPEFESWNDQDAQGWWKLPAVERLLDNGYRVLWTDDDITFGLPVAVRQSLRFSQGFLVCPFTDTGLTQRNLRTISDYLGSLQG